MDKLAAANRLMAVGSTLRYKRYLDDFRVSPISAAWDDTATSGFGRKKEYIVETNVKVVQRCILMTTDPGDLVLDPTCGSGTTAYVAEQWGRRWITTDTSRIALNIAKTRLMTATLPYYRLHDERGDVRQGFQYEKVSKLMLSNIANDEPPDQITLYDQPEADKLHLEQPVTGQVGRVVRGAVDHGDAYAAQHQHDKEQQPIKVAPVDTCEHLSPQ